MSDLPTKNTDRELYREVPGDYYANSVHVTESGSIGMNVGGYVIVQPIREWHANAQQIGGRDVRAQERQVRVDALQSVLGLLLPVWENREPDISEALLCARWIETGKDPYADAQPLPSSDAMRSHP